MTRLAAVALLLWACGACEPKPSPAPTTPPAPATADAGGSPCALACGNGRRVCGQNPEHPDGGSCEDGCAALPPGVADNLNACRAAAADCAKWRACEE